ncbi:MAG: TonB-dependent receptor, partial [Bacteroidota bacterium]
FPARYGGRLSSVLDIRMKDGNMDHWCAEGSFGNISANVTAEGPILKNKASMIVSARRTYFDLLTAPLLLSASNGGGIGGYYFQDLNAKFNYQLDDKNRLYLSGYLGQDKFYANTIAAGLG